MSRINRQTKKTKSNRWTISTMINRIAGWVTRRGCGFGGSPAPAERPAIRSYLMEWEEGFWIHYQIRNRVLLFTSIRVTDERGDNWPERIINAGWLWDRVCDAICADVRERGSARKQVLTW
jgi:hypothetical protein